MKRMPGVQCSASKDGADAGCTMVTASALPRIIQWQHPEDRMQRVRMTKIGSLNSATANIGSTRTM